MLQQNNNPTNNSSFTCLPLQSPNSEQNTKFFITPKSPLSPQCRNIQPLTNEPADSIQYKKCTEQEGFAFDHEEEDQFIFAKKEEDSSSTGLATKKFIPYRVKEPKIKLTFISKQKRYEPLSTTVKKQYENKSMQIKNNTQSRSMIFNPQKHIKSCVIKIKRNFVADNIIYHNYSTEENKKIKFQIISAGNKIVYELYRETSTFAHLSLLRQNSEPAFQTRRKGSVKDTSGTLKDSLEKASHQLKETMSFIKSYPDEEGFFLDNPLNQLLKYRLKQSFIHHKRRQTNKKQLQEIEFDSQFESANLEFAAKVNNFEPNSTVEDNQFYPSAGCSFVSEYNLYIRNDTNTHGHQNWFYFRLKNNTKQQKRVKLNVFNLKRNLALFKEGQRIYVRTISPFKSDWKLAGEAFDIKENKITTVYRCKVRILSFQFQTNPQTQYEISLLPPYTYSQMLNDIQSIKSNRFAKVQTLTYSLVGLAIPILTFTNPQIQDANKEVILISSRIHPGETVASYITKGLIECLNNLKDSSQIQEFYNTTIIKIIPMINPDGVVFGNFRTNYLGYDLNRSFHSEDQITNPEVTALKELGRKLRSIHGQKFHTFIDLHGHSSQKNIFTYGPDFQNGHQNFYKARLLPKLLNSKSPYFKYGSCSFKLEQYKSSTARAFFLNLSVPSFTIESSYAFYEGQNSKNESLTQKQWIKFGQSLYQSFSLISRLNKTHSIKNRTQLKRAISLSQDQNMNLLNTLRKEMKKQESARRNKKSIQKGLQDSDGENEQEDLDASEREQIEKKLVENTIRNVVLPKVFKPTILYPTITPKIFNIGETNATSYKILYTRRNRYQSIKMPANGYIHSLQEMQSLKPQARNIRIQKKIEW